MVSAGADRGLSDRVDMLPVRDAHLADPGSDWDPVCDGMYRGQLVFHPVSAPELAAADLRIRTAFYDHEKRRVLRKLLCLPGPAVCKKELEASAVDGCGGEPGVCICGVPGGAALPEYQYGVHGCACGLLSGGDGSFAAVERQETVSPAAGYERVGLPVTFLLLLRIFLDGSMESGSADRAEYRALYLCADGAVCVVHGLSVRAGAVSVDTQADLTGGRKWSGKLMKEGREASGTVGKVSVSAKGRHLEIFFHRPGGFFSLPRVLAKRSLGAGGECEEWSFKKYIKDESPTNDFTRFPVHTNQAELSIISYFKYIN